MHKRNETFTLALHASDIATLLAGLTALAETNQEVVRLQHALSQASLIKVISDAPFGRVDK